MVLCKAARISKSRKQSCREKGENLLFSCGEIAENSVIDILRREDSVMITDLAAVQDAFRIQRDKFCVTPFLLHETGKAVRGVLHFIREIPAVCSRVRRELFLIEALRDVEGLLGSKSIQPVCIPLQRCQVIEKRRLLFALCLLHL